MDSFTLELGSYRFFVHLNLLFCRFDADDEKKDRISLFGPSVLYRQSSTPKNAFHFVIPRVNPLRHVFSKDLDNA